MIQAGLVDEFITGIWDRIAYFVTLQFVDPFWGWFVLGFIIILAVTAVAWFFGALPMIGGFLRAGAGVIVLLVTFGLYAYRKGENDARAHDAGKPKPKPKPKPVDPPWWGRES